MNQRIKKGMKFRSPYADSNPLWETKKSLGGSWLCVVVNEPVEYKGQMIDSDWAGTEKAFLTADIHRAVAYMRMFEDSEQEDRCWYDSLPLGTVVHYNDGFRSFVRCEIVMGADRNEPNTKRKVLKPIALVGDWRPIDLPGRRLNGSIYLSIHAQNIADGKCFSPHYSNVYESPAYSKDKGNDPTALKPVDLTVPPMSEEEAETARLWTVIDAVRTAMTIGSGDEKCDMGNPATPKMLLKRAIQELEKAGLLDESP